MSAFPGARKAGRRKPAGQERKVSAPRIEERESFLSAQLPEGSGLATRNLEAAVCFYCDDGNSIHLYLLLVKKQCCTFREVHFSLIGEIAEHKTQAHIVQYRDKSPYFERRASTTF